MSRNVVPAADHDPRAPQQTFLSIPHRYLPHWAQSRESLAPPSSYLLLSTLLLSSSALPSWQKAARVCYPSNLLNGIKQCGALPVTSGVSTKTRSQAP